MRDPLLRSRFGKLSCENSAGDSWLYRVRENLAQLLLPSHFKPSSANGAPIHLLKFDKSLRPARAQGASLLTHIAICIAILFLLLRVPPPRHPAPPGVPTLITYRVPLIRTTAVASLTDGGSRGGGKNQIPATRGGPPHQTLIQIVRPTIPQSQHAVLPEPPSIPDATAVPNPADRIGLQWMRKDTDSPGPGNGHGVGPDDGNGMGERGTGPYGNGEGNHGYGPGFVPPICSYCPYPTYSDDARKAKVQGGVMLQVLVGSDGRAQSIRVVKGIGFGLDERAIETVRNWKFIPAHDGAKRPVPAWVTVEATFRLF